MMKTLLKSQKAKTFLCLIALGILFPLSRGYQSAANNTEEMIDWGKIKSAFDAFLEYPSPENSKAFLDSIPRDETKNERGDKSKIMDYIIDSFNYGILENEIWAGNRYAVEAAFRLLNFSDGEFAETLCTTLGTLIRINPRLFLEAIYEYRNSWVIRVAGPPVHNFDLAYADRLKAQTYEYKMRIKALESVKDPKYSEIIKACVRQLNEAIRD